MVMVDAKDWRYYTPRVTNGPAFAPVVWANYVAYEGSNSQIYLVDMNDGKIIQVSQSGTQNTNPQIGQNLVTWEEHTDKRQICGYRIGSGECLQITDDPGEENCGGYTDGKTVVWYNKGISAYDVATRARTQVSRAGYYPDVSDGIVVYLKGVNNHIAVFGYDLAAREEFPHKQRLLRLRPIDRRQPGHLVPGQ